MTKDPVCQMDVDPATDLKFIYKETPYYFCAKHCLDKFKNNPEKYLGTKPQPASHGTFYCPMHPEVVQEGFGFCPKCGMALEPKLPTLDSLKNPELEYMTKRLTIALIFTVPLLYFSMGSMIGVVPNNLIFLAGPWWQLFFTTPVVFLAGFPLMERGWQSLKSFNLNMFTLISLGILAAFGFSILVMALPQLIQSAISSGHQHLPIYFESAATITTLVLLGQVLELKARDKTQGAIKLLLGLTPKTAVKILPDGTDVETPIEEIIVGDKLRVKPGEKIPVDGVIFEGSPFIDESMVTGEPAAKQKLMGAQVFAGTLNQNQSFVLKAEKVGSETLLSQIVQMVAQAQSSRAAVQNLVDKVSNFFVPIVILTSLLTALGWYLFGPEPKLANMLVNSIAVLIIACPCALGLATPMSLIVAIGNAARHGILIKDAESLENFSKVTIALFDKTGTLTLGKPSLKKIFPLRLPEKEMLRLLASIEKYSEHPLAKAIVTGALVHKIGFKDFEKVENFQAHTGKGVSGKIKTGNLFAGTKEFLIENSIKIEELGEIEIAQKSGDTVIFLGLEKEFLGAVSVADTLKLTSKTVVETLKRAGIESVMLTGDNKFTAQAVANTLGIAQVFAEVKPQDKFLVVKSLQEKGHKVLMVGDGINDAPALAQADVSCAMATGSDIAMESAGVVIVGNDITKISQSIFLGRRTFLNIKQNLALAFGYNTLAIPLAAGVLYPHFGILLSPVIAAAAMSLSSVSVIMNSLRLSRFRI